MECARKRSELVVRGRSVNHIPLMGGVAFEIFTTLVGVKAKKPVTLSTLHVCIYINARGFLPAIKVGALHAEG